jgi:ABC-type nitrate/sulfonate/bicarbonate transport system permease component
VAVEVGRLLSVPDTVGTARWFGRLRFPILRTRVTGFALVVALLLLWECSARLGWMVSQNWPPFSLVLTATWRGLWSGELAAPLAASMARMVSGYLIGSSCGIVLGLLLGTVRVLDRFVTPLIEALRPLPLPALVPPLILFLGLDDALKIFVVAFAVVFPVVVSTVGGVRDIDEVLIGTARTFGASRARTLLRVVLPAAMPSICAGLRISLSLALVTTVVAEMIAGSSGIGYTILQAQYGLRPEEMYAAVLCIAVVGYLLNMGFVLLERRILRWHQRADADV